MTIAEMRTAPQGTDVSVIIPTHNRASLIVEALRSAQSQSVGVREIIVVDDGSTDETRQVIQHIAAGDARVRLVEQANAGANVARNRGVAAAGGAWLAFLDSDDQWKPEKLERQLAAIARSPDAVASFTGITATDAGRPLYDYDTPEAVSLDDLRFHNMLGSTSTALVRRDAFVEAGGFDAGLPSCQDWDLWFRLRRLGSFAIVTEPLTLYDDGPHDRITRNLSRALSGHRRMFQAVLRDVGDARLRRRIRARHATIEVKLYRRAGMPLRATLRAARAFMLQPDRFTARQVLKTAAGR